MRNMAIKLSSETEGLAFLLYFRRIFPAKEIVKIQWKKIFKKRYIFIFILHINSAGIKQALKKRRQD